MQYRFDDYTLDLVKGELIGPGGSIPLRRQTFRLLQALLSQAPALVDRDRLIDEVWGRSALSRNVLPQAISELRQALRDEPSAPRFIETRHRRGYRFIAEVRRVDAAPASLGADADVARVSIEPAGQEPPAAVVAATLSPGWLASIALALVAVLLWMVVGRWGSEPDPALALTQARLLDAVESARREGQADRAVSALRTLLELDPENRGIRMDLAEAELATLNGAAARAAVAGLAADETGARALRLRARIARLDGRIDEAMALAEAAIGQARADSDAEQWLAALREQLGVLRGAGQLAEAESRLAAVLQQDGLLDPGGRRVLALEHVALLRESGSLAEARAAADRLTEESLSPSLALGLSIELALIDSELGDQASAFSRLQTIKPPEGLAPALALALDNARATVMARSGDVEGARSRFEAAFAEARRRGAVAELAALQVNAGLLFARQRRMDEAEALWQQALSVFESLGDRRGQGVVLGNLAAAASARGQLARSDELNQRALALFRELKLDGSRARTAYNLGLARARAGDLAAAAALFEEAAIVYQAIGQLDLLLHVQASRAELLFEAGELAAAAAILDTVDDSDSFAADSLARILVARAGLAQRRAQLDEARQLHERARSLRDRAGLERWAAQSDLDLLRIDFLAGGNPVDIRIGAEALAMRFARWEEARALARAQQLVAEALLTQGRVDEARLALLQARAAAERFPDAMLDLELAWVESWAAHPDEFEPRLRSLAERAQAMGLRARLEQATHWLDGDGQGEEGAAAGAVPLPPYALNGRR